MIIAPILFVCKFNHGRLWRNWPNGNRPILTDEGASVDSPHPLSLSWERDIYTFPDHFKIGSRSSNGCESPLLVLRFKRRVARNCLSLEFYPWGRHFKLRTPLAIRRCRFSPVVFVRISFQLVFEETRRLIRIREDF